MSSPNRVPRTRAACIACVAACLAALLLPTAARAANVQILFDKVKVTARTAGGATILSAQALGDGPFKDTNGGAGVDFLNLTTMTFLPNFTGAAIVANQSDLRYFGSVAATKGSFLLNRTDVKVKDLLGTQMGVAGVTITGFEIKVTQPTLDTITVAKGGSAFPTVSDLTKDNKSVTFSGGTILNQDYPAVGNSGEFLWSMITPTAPQPKSPLVFFTPVKIPPDNPGDFKDLRYAGRFLTAPAVPEASSFALLALGLVPVGLLARKRRQAA